MVHYEMKPAVLGSADFMPVSEASALTAMLSKHSKAGYVQLLEIWYNIGVVGTFLGKLVCIIRTQHYFTLITTLLSINRYGMCYSPF